MSSGSLEDPEASMDASTAVSGSQAHENVLEGSDPEEPPAEEDVELLDMHLRVCITCLRTGFQA